MKIYLVGGAVRDKKLGFPVKERDWVVVGATVAEMQRLGYRQVGKEFPVFLHPQTREEYALARTERKIDRGYKGFTFDTSLHVTLEEDLERRDLTINAMAETPEGELIDPYHGMADLQQKILRHVSPAFAEDPVRILRVGRFFARYAHLGFHIAPETITLMQTMTAAGEVDALVAERVWKELERALGEQNPEKFFAALDMCDALPILFPAITLNSPGMAALQTATTLTADTAVRFAALLHAIPQHKEVINALATRYRAPNAYRELALLTAAQHANILSSTTLSADDIAKLFNNVDIYRRLARFKLFLLTCQAIARTRSIDFDMERWLALADAARSVDVQVLLAQGLKNAELAQKIKEKRKEKITQWLLQGKN